MGSERIVAGLDRIRTELNQSRYDGIRSDRIGKDRTRSGWIGSVLDGTGSVEIASDKMGQHWMGLGGGDSGEWWVGANGVVWCGVVWCGVV